MSVSENCLERYLLSSLFLCVFSYLRSDSEGSRTWLLHFFHVNHKFSKSFCYDAYLTNFDEKRGFDEREKQNLSQGVTSPGCDIPRVWHTQGVTYPGGNFFACADPKSKKNTVKLSVFFWRFQELRVLKLPVERWWNWP